MCRSQHSVFPATPRENPVSHATRRTPGKQSPRLGKRSSLGILDHFCVGNRIAMLQSQKGICGAAVGDEMPGICV